eukprot:TRINITY_DN16684_c0_g3_i1.p1 TRINITY_DN16684_c0_g3~~TRINITY_DN16684_c0_g3_i1.p1  ORF type:complete len:134 (-),score=47.45 TRINITY_DN16684_c0_g3_i1:11-412(-)
MRVNDARLLGIPDLREQLASAATNEVIDTTIDALKLTAYLQDRFDDSSLFVNDFRALMGGFGKQTFLFSVQGRSLAGEYVIRRDANQPFVDNDCHRIDIEFQMIRAARAHGFPEIGRAVQQECRDRSRMPSSA